MKKRILSVLLALLIFAGLLPAAVVNAQGGVQTRTVLLYVIGTNLESDCGYFTWNLKQITAAEYDENLQFIVFTGGAEKWQTPSEYLEGADHIDAQRNQIWKVEGKREGEEHGKMILLEEAGLPGYETSSVVLPETLAAFLDYGYANFPADKFDLILWDHGSGPAAGFGGIDGTDDSIELSELVTLFSGCALIRDGKQFELINFDACDMGSVEVLAALCDFSEYFVFSPEDLPGDGNEYTTWLNELKNHPEMNGFQLGKIIVDAMIAYYNGKQPAALTVASTANFKKRLLPKLIMLDDIFISEIRNPGAINGRYNFYDEFYALENTISYASNHAELRDLGNFLGAISVPQSESNNITDEEIEQSRNVYTDLALEILAILGDQDGSGDDVIYSGSTGISRTVTAGYFRDKNGEITWPDEVTGKVKIYPTGLSIYFSGDTVLMSTLFVPQMILTASAVTDPAAKSYLLQRAKVAAYYAQIFGVGYFTSLFYKQFTGEITLDSLKELMAKNEANKTFLDFIQLLCDELVSLGEFNSVEEANEFFSQIMAQQGAEVISADKTRVKAILNYDGSIDRYRVIVSDISAQALMEVNGSSKIGYKYEADENFVRYVKNFYGDNSIKALYPAGASFSAQACIGEVDTNEFIQSFDNSVADFYRAIYSANTITWTVPMISSEYSAVYDCDNNPYLADIKYNDLSHQTAYLPISVLFDYDGMSISDFLFLYLVREEEKWSIKGWVSSVDDTPDRLRALSDYDFENRSIALATPIEDRLYNYRINVPISPFFKADPSKENLGLTFGKCRLEETEYYEKLIDSYCINDVYKYSVAVTDRFSAADEAAKNGDTAYSINLVDEIRMNPVIADGSVQTPALVLIHGDKELTESTDYKIIYDGSSDPGPAYALVLGLGDYADYLYVNYVIQCAEHTYETTYEIAPTCTEDGRRYLKCSACGYETSEDIPAGHTLTRVPASKATEQKAGNIEYWTCSGCKKCFLDEAATRETTAEKVARSFTGYRHDPSNNPEAMKDIVTDANAIYGFRPSQNGSLKQYAEADWSDPEAVESGRKERIAYHESIGKLYDIMREMLADGKTVEEIARAVSAERNKLRLAAYDNDPEGLATVKARNLEKYGHEEGPLPDELYEKYGSWETVMEKAFSSNIGMDACLGLYDDYYPLYILLGQAQPVEYKMTQSAAVYSGGENGITFISNADFADFLAVKVDGMILNSVNYVAEAGSTKITLKPSYLKTLTPTAHTVTVLSSDGEATAEFSVASAVKSPKTDDVGEPVFCVLLALLSLFAVAGAVRVYRNGDYTGFKER